MSDAGFSLQFDPEPTAPGHVPAYPDGYWYAVTTRGGGLDAVGATSEATLAKLAGSLCVAAGLEWKASWRAPEAAMDSRRFPNGFWYIQTGGSALQSGKGSTLSEALSDFINGLCALLGEDQA